VAIRRIKRAQRGSLRLASAPSNLSVSRMGEHDLDLTLAEIGSATAMAHDAYGEQKSQRVKAIQIFQF
jgi:hypothetical protein